MLFTALTKKEKKGQYDCSKISRENKKRLKKECFSQANTVCQILAHVKT